jgi:hypothetical protein
VRAVAAKADLRLVGVGQMDQQAFARPTDLGFSYRRGRDLAETVRANNNNANAAKADKSKLVHDKFPGDGIRTMCECLSKAVMSSRGNGDISKRSHQAPVHEWSLRAPDAFSMRPLR